MDLFADFLASIPVRKPRKVTPKVFIKPSQYDLKALYYDARKIMFEREYPQAWKDGKYYDNAFPKIATTNGTMNYIQDVINNSGHQAERINTMGIKKADGKWRPSGSTKGSADVSCIIKIPSQPYPVPWKIEVKKGADSLSGAQEKYQAKVTATGALHSVVYVGDLDFFWDEFNRILSL